MPEKPIIPRLPNKVRAPVRDPRDTPGVISPSPKMLEDLSWLWRDVRTNYVPNPKRDLTYTEIKNMDTGAPPSVLYKNLLPPAPTWFQRDPLIQGRPTFVRAASKLVNADPYVKKNVDKILIGPSTDVIKMLLNLKVNPMYYEISDITGMYDPTRKEISISPRRFYGRDKDGMPTNFVRPDSSDDANQKLETLAHELTHTTGYQHGDKYNFYDKFYSGKDPADAAGFYYMAAGGTGLDRPPR